MPIALPFSMPITTDSGNLEAKPRSGPPRKLSDADFQKLEQLLSEGATAHGWPNDLWTTARVSRVIQKHFRVKYHCAHISRLLRNQLNWTCQRPVHQHTDRDDQAIAEWVRIRFPRLLRKARMKDAHLVFIDETGFMLEPNVRRTYAPCGKTPIVRVSNPHGRISVIGAIVIHLRSKRTSLKYDLLPDNTNFRGGSVVQFVRSLQTAIPGPMTILWDQIPIHAGEPIDKYLASENTIVIEPLPPYAPELNAADGIWRYIKHGRIANYAAPNLSVLRKTVMTELTRLRNRSDLLNSFIRFTKLPIDL
jgi:transposase